MVQPPRDEAQILARYTDIEPHRTISGTSGESKGPPVGDGRRVDRPCKCANFREDTKPTAREEVPGVGRL